MALVAGADLGSNNFRLLVAEEISPGVFSELALHNRIVRAGQGIGAEGGVNPEAVERVRGALEFFRRTLDGFGVEKRVAAVTAAGRDLAGGNLFERMAGEILGAEVFIPTGIEEAKLSFSGAMGVLGVTGGDRMMLDIGGGSTEVGWVSESGESRFESVKTGVVRLTEQLGLGIPATERGLAVMKARAADSFAAIRENAGLSDWREKFHAGGGSLVATAGTALTLAAHESGRPIGATRGLSGVTLSREEVDGFAERLCRMTLREIEALPAIAPGRGDVILAGVAILSTFMEEVGAARCAVSDGGLAEGLVFGFSTSESGHIELRVKEQV